MKNGVQIDISRSYLVAWKDIMAEIMSIPSAYRWRCNNL